MEVRAKAVPTALSSRAQWVLWSIVTRGGEPTKLPFQPNGEPAKSNDASTWSSFAEAHAQYTRGGYDGIGFVFSSDDDLCGIDLDGCRDPETGKVAEWARQIVLDFDTYTEVSPSGTGVKLFLFGQSPFASGKKKELTDVPRVANKTSGIELYDHKRYFAVTGQRLQGRPAEPQQLSTLLATKATEWFGEEQAACYSQQAWGSDEKVAERARQYVAKLDPAITGQGGHNRAFHAACVLCLGFGLSPEEAYPIFCEYSDRCQPPWSEREIWHKLNDADQQPGERNYLRDVAPRQWQNVPVPRYEAPKPLPQVKQLSEAASEYLEKLQSGRHRLMSVGIGEVDYAIGGGIEEGELVVVGARSGHGKTCFGLQSVYQASQEGRPCLIVSEEMSSIALGKRAIQSASGVAEEHWKMEAASVREDVRGFFGDRAPIYVSDSCGTSDRVAEAVRKAAQRQHVEYVMVDYAQLIQSKGRSRYEQVTNTSVALRQVANETGVTLVMLCQLSRQIESREKFIPRMSDLKESGQIEQDADVILFLCWPHRLDSTKDPQEFFVFVGKNRNRAILQSVVQCQFYPSRQRVLESGGDFDWLQEGSTFGEDAFAGRKDLF